MQADSIIPNIYNPLDLDRYSYVQNNPIMYNDPSGHKYCENDICRYEPTPHDPFFVVLKLNKATGLNLYNTGQANAQAFYYNGETHVNLCGHASVQMIYETITGQTNTLGYIYDNLKDDTGVWGPQLAALTTKIFPDNWSAEYLYGKDDYSYSHGGKITTKISDRNWYVDEEGKSIYREVVTEQLMQGNYVIAGVKLDTSTSRLTNNKSGTSHWVVVRGTQDGYVYINDPFTNTTGIYSWGEFISAANADGSAIVIVSPG